jgi:hypothetical protein
MMKYSISDIRNPGLVPRCLITYSYCSSVPVHGVRAGVQQPHLRDSPRAHLPQEEHQQVGIRDNFISSPTEHPTAHSSLITSAADPDPGSGAVLTPGSRFRGSEWNKIGSGSGMNIPDNFSRAWNYFFRFKNT